MQQLNNWKYIFFVADVHFVYYPLPLSAFVRFWATPPPPSLRTSFMDGPLLNLVKIMIVHDTTTHSIRQVLAFFAKFKTL